MKQWFFASVIVTAVIAPACKGNNEPCEYKSTETTAIVSVTPGDWAASDACYDPVKVKLTWSTGDWVLTTNDGTDLPAACLNDIGLSDGGEVKISIQEGTKESCPPLSVSLVGADISICDALCDTVPQCPPIKPTIGESCDRVWPCYYGEPYVCPLAPGTTTFYSCGSGTWETLEIPNDFLCDPPPCSTCSDAIIAPPALPPEKISFCSDTSAVLYEAFWTCACVASNPCAAVCNPDVNALCKGASPSPECVDCLVNVPAPNGCMNETAACENDF